MSKEQAGTTGKVNTKKWGIIGAIAVILIALIVGISIYNSSAKRLSRRLDLGKRYLEEQNYEQAVIEFDRAIAIAPMSVDAYLGESDAYMGMGNLRSAFDTLQTGYDLTGDGRLKGKLVEVKKQLDEIGQVEEVASLAMGEVQIEEQDYTVLPFSVTDIKIQGYDLLEPHLDEIVAAFGIAMEQNEDGIAYGNIANSYGSISAYEGVDGGEVAIVSMSNDNNGTYIEDSLIYQYYNAHALLAVSNKIDRGDIEAVCDLLILPGDTYEEWRMKIGADIIKNSAEQRFEEEYYTESLNSILASKKIISEDGWYVNSYYEAEASSSIKLSNESGPQIDIAAFYENGIIDYVTITCFYDNE